MRSSGTLECSPNGTRRVSYWDDAEEPISSQHHHHNNDAEELKEEKSKRRYSVEQCRPDSEDFDEHPRDRGGGAGGSNVNGGQSGWGGNRYETNDRSTNKSRQNKGQTTSGNHDEASISTIEEESIEQKPSSMSPFVLSTVDKPCVDFVESERGAEELEDFVNASADHLVADHFQNVSRRMSVDKDFPSTAIIAVLRDDRISADSPRRERIQVEASPRSDPPFPTDSDRQQSSSRKFRGKRNPARFVGHSDGPWKFSGPADFPPVNVQSGGMKYYYETNQQEPPEVFCQRRCSQDTPYGWDNHMMNSNGLLYRRYSEGDKFRQFDKNKNNHHHHLSGSSLVGSPSIMTGSSPHENLMDHTSHLPVDANYYYSNETGPIRDCHESSYNNACHYASRSNNRTWRPNNWRYDRTPHQPQEQPRSNWSRQTGRADNRGDFYQNDNAWSGPSGQRRTGKNRFRRDNRNGQKSADYGYNEHRQSFHERFENQNSNRNNGSYGSYPQPQSRRVSIDYMDYRKDEEQQYPSRPQFSPSEEMTGRQDRTLAGNSKDQFRAPRCRLDSESTQATGCSPRDTSPLAYISPRSLEQSYFRPQRTPTDLRSK